MDNALVKLYKSPKTVLTTADIAVLWNEINPNNLKAKISYYVNREVLIRLRGGIFAKDKNYNPKELASSICIPSYVSFETVLREAGMIFQYYNAIYSASYKTQSIKAGGLNFNFRKIKDAVLYNAEGIISGNNFSQATPERAFLDMIYLHPRYYFDNLDSLNWEKCAEMVKIYQNRQLIKRLEEYRKKYAE